MKTDPNQQDFLVADMLGNYTIKDDQGTMEAPIFSLSTNIDLETWNWTSVDGTKTIEVTCGLKGRATQHDKDIIIYCISQIMHAKNQGQKISRTVRFKVYDYLKQTGKTRPGDAYKNMELALDRLKQTNIKTNMINGKNQGRITKGFGIIDDWTMIEKSPTNQIIAVEIKLSDWIWQAIETDNVLTLNREYFFIRKALTKRLYEIARKHVGQQPVWIINANDLQKKCGSKRKRISHFIKDIEHIMENDELPDYSIAIIDNNAIFRPKNTHEQTPEDMLSITST